MELLDAVSILRWCRDVEQLELGSFEFCDGGVLQELEFCDGVVLGSVWILRWRRYTRSFYFALVASWKQPLDA